MTETTPAVPLSDQEAETVARFGLDKPERRTTRKYAHELYPHPEDGETRSLAVDVPYLYSRAIGFEIHGTGWFDAEPRSIGGQRADQLLDSRLIALMADAMYQGLTGQEAWEWADQRASEETGEWIGERSEVYGVDYYAIKPYPCGPEPDHHEHLGPPDRRGFRQVTIIHTPESDCEECTEPMERAS